MKVAITGGLGRSAEYLIPELMQHGHEPILIDLPERLDIRADYRQADVTDLGQTLYALNGTDAVVHLARAGATTAPERRFRENVMQTWNVLQTAETLGIGRIVLASSVNAMGAVYNLRRTPPDYFPVDEEHPTRAQEAYSLSKWLGEQIADGFARRREVQIASLRLHALLGDEELVSACAECADDPDTGADDFWSYTALRDAASAERLALEADWDGHEVFFINAADTTLRIPTADAIERYYPGVPLRRELTGSDSAIDIEKARRLLGWQPRVTWRAGPLGDCSV